MINEYLSNFKTPTWLLTGILPYAKMKGYTVDENPFSEWLYGEYDEEKLKHFEMLYSTPLHYYMDYLLDRRADEEYLNRYGMDYPDIHDPRKLSQTGAFTELAHVGLNFVSDNVKRLYR